MPHARDDRRDRELLRDLASGGPDALAELYDRHAASLYRHAIALARSRADAEDLVQGVFVKLAGLGRRLLGVQTPMAYLHRMLHTAWLDARRRTTTGDRVVEQAMMPHHTAAPALEDSLDLTRALDLLPPEQREVILLHLVEGFSFREIGQSTGVSLFTAAGRYRLGIGRLRRALRTPVELPVKETT